VRFPTAPANKKISFSNEVFLLVKLQKESKGARKAEWTLLLLCYKD
jgi:hypothetical protein